MRLWIDTDIGEGAAGNPDDGVAIALAAAHPQIELVGISVVGPDPVVQAEHALATARAAGAGDPLVYASAPDPRVLAEVDAVLAIGPLTNCAALIRAGVRLPPLAVMGGALGPVVHRGAATAVESNFAADPHAAMIVLGGAGELLLVPLDVTAEMVLRAPERAALLDALPWMRASIESWELDNGAPLCVHDPLALLALVGEAEAVIEERSLGVTVDGRVVEAADGPRVEVVTAVGRDRAIGRMLDLIGG